jgi:D-alanine-D-alanine ligase
VTRVEPEPIIKAPAESKSSIKMPKGIKKMEQVLPTRKTISKQTIEIITLGGISIMRPLPANVGIDLDHELILKILSTRYQNVTITPIYTQDDLERLAVRKPDLVFSGVKYFSFEGEEIWLNDFLDEHAIAYVASTRASLDSEFDKACAKIIIQEAGVTTADFFVTRPGLHEDIATLPLAFPLFVKPVQGGDSKGVDEASVVHDFEAFETKVKSIKDEQHSDALVETYLDGREYSVGILQGIASVGIRAMPVEIIAAPNKNGDRILDYEMKKQDMESVEAVTDGTVHAKLSALAKAAFKALNGRLLGRIDIKMDHNCVPHFIEANLMPGLRKGYFYRACMLNLQMTYDEMILAIAENGLAHRLQPLPPLHANNAPLMPERTIEAGNLHVPIVQ